MASAPHAEDPMSPVQFLSGVGPVRAKKLEKLGISVVLDLLWHVPRTYMDRSRITPLSDLEPGGTFTAIAEVVTARSHRTFRRMSIFEVVLSDEQTVAEGTAIAQSVMGQLGIGEDDLIEGAYVDMIVGRRG